jgi:hypothetical protein
MNNCCYTNSLLSSKSGTCLSERQIITFQMVANGSAIQGRLKPLHQ